MQLRNLQGLSNLNISTAEMTGLPGTSPALAD